MPYPKYTSHNQPQRPQQRGGGGLNPWDSGGGGGMMMGGANPIALVNNLMGALMQQQNLAPHQGMQDRPRDDDYRRRRSRSPPRRRQRTRSRSRQRRQYSPPPAAKRRRPSPPADRPEHEIYIGNYPANYTEAQVRDLFSSFSIEIGQIRMKCDGHKVFGFAEAANPEIVAKAVQNMDAKEIEGRRLRVRGSKKQVSNNEPSSSKNDADRTDRKDEDKSGSKRRRERSRPRDKERRKAWIPKVEDSKLHLVNAFLQFLKREKKKSDHSEDFKSTVETVTASLSAAFQLPEDNSLKVNRDIEDIFFRAIRLDLKPPVEETVKSEEQDLVDAVMASENVYAKDKDAANNGTDGKKIKTEDEKKENGVVNIKDEKKENGVVNIKDEKVGNDDEATEDKVDEDEEEEPMEDDLADLENCLAEDLDDNHDQQDTNEIVDEEQQEDLDDVEAVDDDNTGAIETVDDEEAVEEVDDEEAVEEVDDDAAVEAVDDTEAVEEIEVEPEPVKKSVGTPSRGRRGRRGGRK